MLELLLLALLLSVVVLGANAISCADWCNIQYAPNSPGGWIDGTAVLSRYTKQLPRSIVIVGKQFFL